MQTNARVYRPEDLAAALAAAIQNEIHAHLQTWSAAVQPRLDRHNFALRILREECGRDKFLSRRELNSVVMRLYGVESIEATGIPKEHLDDAFTMTRTEDRGIPEDNLIRLWEDFFQERDEDTMKKVEADKAKVAADKAKVAAENMEGRFFSIWGGILGGLVPLLMLLEPTPPNEVMIHGCATCLVAMICALSGFAAPAALESCLPESRRQRTFARFIFMWTGVLAAIVEMTGLEGKAVDDYLEVVFDHRQLVLVALALFTAAAVASTMMCFCVVLPPPFRRRAEGLSESLLV